MAYRAQRIVPVSDVVVGSWTTTPLWSKIDEYPISDTDFISSPTITTGTTSSAFFGGNTGNVTPITRTDHRIVIRARKVGSANMYAGVSVHQGFNFLIAYRSLGPVTNTFQEYSFSLTQQEMNSITNYNDLIFESVGVVSGTSGITGSVEISGIYLETPSRTQIITHTVDALIAAPSQPAGGQVVWNNTTTTWNGQSIYWGVVAKTHSVDALLATGVQQRTVSHAVDAYRSLRPRKTHTVDALLSIKRTRTHTVNAVLLKKQLRTHSVDALRRKTSTRAHTVNAVLLKKQTRSHTVNAALLKKQLRTHSVSAICLKKQLLTHTVNAIRLGKIRPTHLVNAIIARRPQGTHAVDATLLKKRTTSHSVDVGVSLRSRKTHGADALIARINRLNHGVDAEIQAVPQFVELVSAGGSSSIVLSTTPVEGELMVAQIACRATKQVTSVPEGWQLIRVDVTADTTESGSRQYAYYKVAGEVENGTYTWELGDI